MEPHILLTGVALFLFSLTLHVILWRWRHPQQQILCFLLLFLLPLPLLALGLYGFYKYFPLGNFLSIGLVHIALCCAYIQTYPACQALSPSLMVLLLVGNAMPRGMTEGEICARFASEILLENRIQDLLASGFIRETGGQFEITFRGLLLVSPGIVLRKILGLSAGKG